MQSVEDLNVYKLGFDVSVMIYKITENFPSKETFGLVSQMRRCAISVNSNLVEGAGRNTSGEYKHFVGISNGSTLELIFQIRISRELGYISDDVANDLVKKLKEISKMLNGLIKKLGELKNGVFLSHQFFFSPHIVIPLRWRRGGIARQWRGSGHETARE